MNAQIVCSLISVLGVILSGLISYLTARRTAKMEMDKLRETWKREDSLSVDSEFSDMVKAVTRTYYSVYDDDKEDAVAKIFIVRSKCSLPISVLLDRMIPAIRSNDHETVTQLLRSVSDMYHQQL